MERDAVERYWRAVGLADGARAAWQEAGCPLTVRWANGTESVAPLLKVLQGCERDAERFARAVPRPPKRPGRPVEAVVRAIGEAPAAKLRRAK